jgi:hypothetical protein
MERNLLLDIIGWLGVAALLIAYALVSTRRIAGDSVRYQALNLIGSGCLLVNSFYYGAFPSVDVNAAWLGIGVWALARAADARR